jgi:L-asparagine transporter-like permease
MSYLTQWQFWFAVIAVAVIVHFIMGFVGGKSSS